MTDQITVPKQTWDAMREALESVEWHGGGSCWIVDDDKIEAALTAANAVSLPQATEPAGWKLVPVEPTPEMCDAARWSEYGEETSRQYEVSNEFIQSVWASLLAAAPEAHHE